MWLGMGLLLLYLLGFKNIPPYWTVFLCIWLSMGLLLLYLLGF